MRRSNSSAVYCGGASGRGRDWHKAHVRSSSARRPTAAQNRIEGNWKQFKGRAKEKWGRLTDDDLDVVNGRRDQLDQERYGLAKDRAKQDVDAWSNSLTNIT